MVGCLADPSAGRLQYFRGDVLQLIIFLVGNNGLSLPVIQLIMSGNFLPKFLYFLLRLLVRHLIFRLIFFSPCKEKWKLEEFSVRGPYRIEPYCEASTQSVGNSLPSRTRVQARNIDDIHQMLHKLEGL